VLPELVEAAVRCHQPKAAQPALEALRAHTRLGGTDWGLGVETYSRALLAEGAAAEELHTEAIGRLGRTRMRLPLAAPTCSTGNGCAASAAAPTPAPSCPPPTTCSRRWAPGPSPGGPGRN